MKKALTKLLLTFLVTNQAFAVTPVDSGAPEIICYSIPQREKIAQAITDLKKCQVDTTAKDELITKNMLTFDGVNSGPSWWQEPSFVFGGMIVSVALGGMVTFLVMRQK